MRCDISILQQSSTADLINIIILAQMTTFSDIINRCPHRISCNKELLPQHAYLCIKIVIVQCETVFLTYMGEAPRDVIDYVMIQAILYKGKTMVKRWHIWFPFANGSCNSEETIKTCKERHHAYMSNGTTGTNPGKVKRPLPMQDTH